MATMHKSPHERNKTKASLILNLLQYSTSLILFNANSFQTSGSVGIPSYLLI